VTALLSRVADHVYWAARYLERAEDTARIVKEQTDYIVDIPHRLNPKWAPLLAITGTRDAFDATYPNDGEHNVIRFLLADPDHPGSVLRSVELARENLRSTREVLPREAWQALNDTYLYCLQAAEDGVARRGRPAFLARIVGDCQRVAGILEGTMRRDQAFAFMRLGRSIERADMTTRVLDVRASDAMATAPDVDGPKRFESVAWMSVLRSLSSLQMYHRATVGGVDGAPALRFLLRDRSFPRSVAHALDEIERNLEQLPHAELCVEATRAARVLVAAAPVDSLLTYGLHEEMDRMQLAIGAIHDRVVETYFSPS
jgi:uncharacterized alpha-E superfamily protein